VMSGANARPKFALKARVKKNMPKQTWKSDR